MRPDRRPHSITLPDSQKLLASRAATTEAQKHHTVGIYDAERHFGRSLTNSAGRVVPIRWIGEQHVREDCQGRIPSLADWLGRIQPEPWMANGRIDNDPTQIVGDPRAAWVEAVTGHQTILGFEEWLLMVSVEHVQHRQNRAAA